MNAVLMNRREFLITTAVVGGGLAISLVAGDAQANAARTAGGPAEIGPWLTIAPDDSVLLRVPNPESGNGVATFAASLMAEELQCAWKHVRIEAPSLNRDVREKDAYALVAGTTSAWSGRSTTEKTMGQLQQIGASARERLKAAAARQWRVPVAEVEARDSVLTHAGSKRSLRYGEVAAAAASISLPHEPRIRDPRDFTLAGKRNEGKLSDPQIVNGRATYGIDVRVPGMIYGAIQQSPVHGGRLASHDFEAIRKMPGVLGVVVIDPDAPIKRLKTPANDGESHAQSAIVVVAEHYWQARQALDALPVKWNDGAGARWKTTEQLNQSVIAELESPKASHAEKVIQDLGDAPAVLAANARTLEATYLTPFADQAPLEPLNATALYTPERLEIWHGGANSVQSFMVAAEQAGLPFEKVHQHQTMLGGNFGRRNFSDDLRLVVEVAKNFPGRPVQVIWSREEMTRQGRYRWQTAGKLRAALGDDGLPKALFTRICRTGYGIAGIDNIAYTKFGLIPNCRIETRDHPLHVLWGSYRAPGYNSYAFMMESFIDECAQAAGIDPLDYRLKLLAQCPDPGWERCLEEVAAQSGWGTRLPPGQGRGIAISNWGNWVSKDPQSGTTAAVVAHVEVSKAGALRVLQLDIAFDCGRVIDRDVVTAQMQGGAIYGLNMALNEELNLRDGRIVEGNFDEYPMLRLADMPRIKVHFGGLTGHARYSEVGEPPVGPVGPAVANAIFQATGKRIRTMPFRKHDLSWT
jgi:isoquinoline 1-oxidoreductase subunit beta